MEKYTPEDIKESNTTPTGREVESEIQAKWDELQAREFLAFLNQPNESVRSRLEKENNVNAIPAKEKKFVYEQNWSKNGIQYRVVRKFEKEKDKLEDCDYSEADVEIRVGNGDREEIINNFLPPGWIIRQMQTDHPGHGARARTDTKIVEIPRFVRIKKGNRANSRGTDQSFFKEIQIDEETFEIHDLLMMEDGILLVLHEAGHAMIDLSANEDDRKIGQFFRKKAAVLELENKTWDKTFQENFVKFVVQEERDAWYYALRVYRELKNEGLPITSMSPIQILEAMHRFLDSYNEHIS